jgi:hypothetical protein
MRRDVDGRRGEMDPFDTASSALILSTIYHSRKVIHPKGALTRTIHVLVVLSILFSFQQSNIANINISEHEFKFTSVMCMR